MEPGTGLTILGTAIGSAKVLEKILGPTADYIGSGLKSYTEKGISNIGKIFKSAKDRLGEKLEEPGKVHPKVLKEILEGGYFCEDELSTEYFGGVLASSRTTIERDDRGSSFLKLVQKLSAYQVRAHYIFYSSFYNLYEGRELNPQYMDQRKRLYFAISEKEFNETMDFVQNEDPDVIIPHILNGLRGESLIDPIWDRVKGNVFKIPNISLEDYCICVHPSPLGMELFLWIHGKGNVKVSDFLNRDHVLKINAAINIPLAYEGKT